MTPKYRKYLRELYDLTDEELDQLLGIYEAAVIARTVGDASFTDLLNLTGRKRKELGAFDAARLTLSLDTPRPLG